MYFFSNYLSRLLDNKIYKYICLLFISAFCALISSFICKIFLLPEHKESIITGGLSGIAVIITKILELIFNFSKKDFFKIFSIINLLLNVPVIITAFYIGKRFGLLTITFIGSLFIFNQLNFEFVNKLANDFSNQGLFVRTIVAAYIDGILESIIISIGASSGGISTISCYFAKKKKTIKITKFILFFNLFIILIFSLISFLETHNFTNSFRAFIFAMIFIHFSTNVMDSNNFYDTKEQIQIITKKQDLSKIIMQNNQHGATIICAKGAYTNEDETVILTTVTIYETQKIINLVKQYDPNCFISIMNVKKIHGNFQKNFII